MSKALYHDSTPPPANTTTTSTSIPRLHAVSVVDDVSPRRSANSEAGGRKIRTVYLPESMWDAIDAASKETDISVSRIIRMCVQQALPCTVRKHAAGEVTDSDE